MKSNPRIYIGSPLHGDEAAFLRTLAADLAHCDALILANFVVGDRQIDFVVILQRFAALIELKNYRHPVFGDMNGEWRMRDAAGNVVPDKRFNPYQQTLEEAFSLSDAMRDFQRRNPSVPPSPKGAYYRFFHSFVCVYPAIHADSQVTNGDRKVRIRSYPDVLRALRTDGLAAGWSAEQWTAFAERRLKLHLVTLEAAIDRRALAAQGELAGYRQRLQNTLSVGLAPLLDDAAGGAPYGLSLVQAMQGPQNLLLHGPSGSAKTFHLYHLALAMAVDGIEIPLLVDAKRYRGGDFWHALRQSTAPYFTGDLRNLLVAIAETGSRPAVLIDALNECPEAFRDDLLRGALAFALNYDARTIVTTQSAATPLGGFQAERIATALPTGTQKRHIYAYHAGIFPTADIDAFCASFANAYDLVLAGRCHSDGPPPKSRADLYDRYLTRSLPTVSPYVAAALLRHVAGYMHGNLAIALSRNTFENVAERFLTQHDTKLSVLDALLQTGLVETTADSFAFEHELLLTYLAGEQMRRSATDCDALALELGRPRNSGLFEFILPRLDEIQAASIICAAKDKDVLQTILKGESGAAAQAALRGILVSFITDAIDDLKNVEAEIVTSKEDNGKRLLVDVRLRQGRAWSEYEKLLASILVFALHDESLQPLALTLLDNSELALRGAVERAAAELRIAFKPAWAETVRLHGGGVSHGAMLPCSAMLHDLHQQLMRFGGKDDLTGVRKALLTRANAQPQSDFALLALLEDHDLMATPAHVPDSIALIEMAWNSGIGPHRLSALQALPYMRSALDACNPEDRMRVHEFLRGLSSPHLLLNSLILETQALFEVIEPPVSLETAIWEMRTAIAPELANDPDLAAVAQLHSVPVDQLIAMRAYGLLANIFEDVFQGVYYTAYHELSDKERFFLLTLAAQQEERGFHTPWILQELLSCDEARALPTFERYLCALDFTGNFLQDDFAAAVVAIQAWAKWSPTPPPLRSVTPEYDKAFRTIGEALYWAYRGGMDPERHTVMKRKWHDLDNGARLAAGVVLHELRSAGWRAAPTDQDAAPDLKSLWSFEVEAIALYCVENREALMAGLRRYAYDGRLVKEMIETLGAIGTLRALPVLRAVADDSLYSSDAISALQCIQRRGIGIT